MGKPAMLTVRIKPSTKDSLEGAARRRDISVSELVRIALERELAFEAAPRMPALLNVIDDAKGAAERASEAIGDLHVAVVSATGIATTIWHPIGKEG